MAQVFLEIAAGEGRAGDDLVGGEIVHRFVERGHFTGHRAEDGFGIGGRGEHVLAARGRGERHRRDGEDDLERRVDGAQDLERGGEVFEGVGHPEIGEFMKIRVEIPRHDPGRGGEHQAGGAVDPGLGQPGGRK
ncbi:MAG: hypothetical protein R3D59_04705 [Paracoccaceae bacterium]